MKYVDVDVITNEGLTKHVYSFECLGTTLYYASYHQYNRSKKSDPWPDEWPEPKSFIEWVKENNIPEDDLLDYDEYGRDNEDEYHSEYAA